MTVIWCILFTLSGILIFGAANEESPQSRMKRLTTFGKSPTVQTPAPERKLHSTCRNDYECIPGAECTTNSTYRPNEHLCYCKEGYVEENNVCNGSTVSVGWLVLITIGLLVMITPERY